MKGFGLGTYALMLSVVLWGVLLGGIGYSHLVYFPVYLSHLPESSVVVNGQYGLNDGRFWLAVHPVLVLSLIVSLASNWRDAYRRSMVAITLAVYVVILVITSIYFLPELSQFESSPILPDVTQAEWLARGRRWQYLSWIRGGVCFLLILPLLFALARPRNVIEQS
jgi:hypothetical protein